MRSRFSIIGIILLAASVVWAAERFEPSREPLANRDFRGVLAVRSGQVLTDEGSSKLYTPASVLKLVVVATALHHLGTQHRWVTTIAATAPIVKGSLTGDLVLQASGDPTWTRRFHEGDARRPLNELAAQLHRAGLRKVRGDLVLDLSRFPGPGFPKNRQFSERSVWYGAPATGVAIDENVAALRIAPGPRPGASGQVSETIGPFPVVNRVITVGPDRAGRGTVEIAADPKGDRLYVSGEYPIGENAYDLDAVVPGPELYAGEELLSALRRAGITVSGKVKLSASQITEAGEPLARWQSPPLREVIPPILEKSHNWYAEMLLRRVALEVKGKGRIDLGLDVERDFLVQEVGVSPHSFFLEDGSGLAPENLLSPEATVTLLQYVWRQSWREAFVQSLASPSQGTLRGYGDMPSVRAKTGTIQYTQGLAGYLLPESNDPIVFAIFLNHRPGDRGAGQSEILGLLRQWAKKS